MSWEILQHLLSAGAASSGLRILSTAKLIWEMCCTFSVVKAKMLLLRHLLLAVYLASNQTDVFGGMFHLVGNENAYMCFTKVPVQ